MSYNIIPILKALNTDPAIIKLAEGKNIPYIGGLYKLVHDCFYPYPPAFLPIFVDDGNPSMTGILKHWFLERDTVLVNYYLETGGFSEKARNGQQFIADLLLRMDMLEDGLTPEIIEFASDMDYPDIQAIDDHAEEYGDIPSEFYHLKIIGTDPPLSYAPDLEHYKGDYPASDYLLNHYQLHKACSMEVPKDWASKTQLPVWMDKTQNKQQLFEEYLKANELDKAWLTLNSSGWRIGAAIQGLTQIKAKTPDPLFQQIADFYISGWQSANRLHLNY
jgi:hypothetical protein